MLISVVELSIVITAACRVACVECYLKTNFYPKTVACAVLEEKLFTGRKTAYYFFLPLKPNILSFKKI
jgi:hypothetical protein